jgi:transposase
VLDGRDRCTVERWLGALPDEVRAGIESVSIKPYDGYRQAIRAPLPQARIVCDRFRLVRGASSALDVAPAAERAAAFTTRLLSRPRVEGHAYALRLHQQSQGRLRLPPAADTVRQRP